MPNKLAVCLTAALLQGDADNGEGAELDELDAEANMPIEELLAK